MNEADYLQMQLTLFEKCSTARGGQYPRYAVWENVPGAFSSNKGLDFRTVLEEITKTEIPMPSGGKWAEAGMVECPNCQVAWRTMDAQFWGVPQRRKRIYLVADFRGKSAAEILFECKSLSRDIEESQNQRESITTNSGTSIKATSEPINGVLATHLNGRDELIDLKGKSGAVMTQQGSRMATFVCFSLDSKASNSMKSSNPNSGCHVTQKAKTIDTSNQNPSKNQGGIVICVQGSLVGRKDENGPNGKGTSENVCFTLNTIDRHAVCFEPGKAKRLSENIYENKSGALRANMGDNQFAVAYAVENHHQDSRCKFSNGNKIQTLSTAMGTGGNNVPLIIQKKFYCVDQGAGKSSCTVLNNKAPTLACTHGGEPVVVSSLNCSRWKENDKKLTTLKASGGNYGGGSENLVVGKDFIVRRLTPLECERLQAFPDNWTAGFADAPRYKALGNSLALVTANFVISRIAKELRMEDGE